MKNQGLVHRVVVRVKTTTTTTTRFCGTSFKVSFPPKFSLSFSTTFLLFSTTDQLIFPSQPNSLHWLDGARVCHRFPSLLCRFFFFLLHLSIHPRLFVCSFAPSLRPSLLFGCIFFFFSLSTSFNRTLGFFSVYASDNCTMQY